MDKTLLAAGISAIALLAGTAYLVGQWGEIAPVPEVVVLDPPSSAPILVETVLSAPSLAQDLAITGLTPETVVARTPASRNLAADLDTVAINLAPAIGTPSGATELPSIGENPELRVAQVTDFARPTVAVSLTAPPEARSLPAMPAPLDPPPPLTGKLDIPSFAPAPSPQNVEPFSVFDPVVPPVHVAALPRAMTEPAVQADTAPPGTRAAAGVLTTQISYSYWNVAMPFQSELYRDENLSGAVITSVSPDAKLSPSGKWIAKGAIVTAFNGEPLRPETPLSIHILDAMPSAENGFIRAPVEYRDAVMGFAGSGELVVPVVREIGLADGMVLETRKEGASWSTSVRDLGAAQTDLRPGDIVIAELETGRWFGGHEDVEAALNELAEAGADKATFTVLRNGERETVRWSLASE